MIRPSSILKELDSKYYPFLLIYEEKNWVILTIKPKSGLEGLEKKYYLDCKNCTKDNRYYISFTQPINHKCHGSGLRTGAIPPEQKTYELYNMLNKLSNFL